VKDVRPQTRRGEAEYESHSFALYNFIGADAWVVSVMGRLVFGKVPI